MEEVKTKKTKLKQVRNELGIKVNKACMSCLHKDYKDGIRCCKLTHDEEDSRHVCRRWEMSLGLHNAGKKSGVVRLLTEVVIH